MTELTLNDQSQKNALDDKGTPSPPSSGIVEEKQSCKNCGTDLTGPFCHHCGQPAKSVVKFFGSLLHELFEDIIKFDSRAARTLFALMFRPGFLTNEYIRGRVFHYVRPLRLFLFASLSCIFFLLVLNKFTDVLGDANIAEETASTINQNNEIPESLTAPFIENEIGKKLNELPEAERKEVLTELEKANQMVKESTGVDLNLTEQNPPPAPASSEQQTKEQASSTEEDVAVPETPDDSNIGLSLSSEDIEVNIPFLSEEQNRQLEYQARKKFKRFKEDPSDFKSDLFGDLLEMIPKSMLLLVPLFAFLVKINYPFARRYYIEHLVHAIHGHAFLFLAILFALILELSAGALSESKNGFYQLLGSLLSFIEGLLYFWMPIYFLISLRVVYRQHWLLTIWKWFWLGLLYFMLFSLSAAIIFIFSVVT